MRAAARWCSSAATRAAWSITPNRSRAVGSAVRSGAPARSWARVRSRSAPTARTSTSPPRAAMRSLCSSAIVARARCASQRARPAASPPEAPTAARRRSGSTVPTRSRSAPTGATSTRPRGRATRSASFGATRKPAPSPSFPPAPVAYPVLPIPVCAVGRALVGPDVVVISPDGANVYVGSFFGNAVAVFDRDPASGALTQPGDSSGCIAEAIAGCALGFALGAPEGMAISGDGTSVYVASALSNAVVALARDPSTGTLAQASDGSGCVANAALTGCTTGVQLSGANAVAFSPGGERLRHLAVQQQRHLLHPLALDRRPHPEARHGGLPGLAARGRLLLRPGDAGARGAGDLAGRRQRLRRRLRHRRDRRPRSRRQVRQGAQKPGRPGCLAPRSVPGCTRGRALRGVSSIALSPDGSFSTRPRSAATPSTSSGGIK